MRERVLKETGFDMATERKPPNWFPKSPLKSPDPSSERQPSSPARELDGLSRLRPPTATHGMSDVPTMPTLLGRVRDHREKNPRHGGIRWPACIARPVPVHERLSNPKAKKACEEEWCKLLNAGPRGCWDASKVRELNDVRAEVRRKGEINYFGRVHELCYEKNSELPIDDPRRKYKGRDVFLGDQVKDQDGNVALFSDLSSSPATMAASKFADFHGLLPGNKEETADVSSAYLQAYLKGTPTWVEIPKHRWPKEWEGRFHGPVCPLIMALYGHPESGGYWEQHCEEKVFAAGFRRACDCLLYTSDAADE